MTGRVYHSEKFKRDAVKLLDSRPHDSPAKVAKELGIAKSALYRWKAQFAEESARRHAPIEYAPRALGGVPIMHDDNDDEPVEIVHKHTAPERAITLLSAERDRLQIECRALRQTLVVLDTENQ